MLIWGRDRLNEDGKQMMVGSGESKEIRCGCTV